MFASSSFDLNLFSAIWQQKNCEKRGLVPLPRSNLNHLPLLQQAVPPPQSAPHPHLMQLLLALQLLLIPALSPFLFMPVVSCI